MTGNQKGEIDNHWYWKLLFTKSLKLNKKL